MFPPAAVWAIKKDGRLPDEQWDHPGGTSLGARLSSGGRRSLVSRRGFLTRQLPTWAFPSPWENSGQNTGKTRSGT